LNSRAVKNSVFDTTHIPDFGEPFAVRKVDIATHKTITTNKCQSAVAGIQGSADLAIDRFEILATVKKKVTSYPETSSDLSDRAARKTHIAPKIPLNAAHLRTGTHVSLPEYHTSIFNVPDHTSAQREVSAHSAPLNLKKRTPAVRLNASADFCFRQRHNPPPRLASGQIHVALHDKIE
jgi:hypothetical protein